MTKRSSANKLKRNTRLLPWFQQEIMRHVTQYGGFYNAHAHLCRAYTLEESYLRHIGTTPLDASNLPLAVKQNLVGNLHTGIAYTEDSLRKRISHALDMQIAFGVRRIDTNIDATPDLDEDGMLAMRVAKEVKEAYADRIDMRIAPTPIFGFKTKNRIAAFERAVEYSDYLSLLPEKDDFEAGTDADGKIGFKRHLRLGLELACKHGKEFQVHVDQMNHGDESGTEQLLDVLEVLDQPEVDGSGGGPTVWAIHVISPSAYDEYRFRTLVDRLLIHNIGIIVCPSAGLSMRQLRSHQAPTHNSLARMLELLKMKVPVRLGTDNIQDVFVPAADGDMLTELNIGANALRLYSPSIWAKIACGQTLNNVDLNTIGTILYEDLKACRQDDPAWQSALD